jgi:hypothetical protein
MKHNATRQTRSKKGRVGLWGTASPVEQTITRKVKGKFDLRAEQSDHTACEFEAGSTLEQRNAGTSPKHQNWQAGHRPS